MRLACCGNDCEICPRYTATQIEEISELERVLDIWKRAGWRDDSANVEDMRCSGCSTANPCRYEIAACAAERAVANCGLCAEYPCQRVKETFRRTQEYADVCRAIFPDDIFEPLERSFFFKKENLEQVKAGKK
ncbi:MAG: DUF3795 domain-containing protein [Acidobacteriota bacterium]